MIDSKPSPLVPDYQESIAQVLLVRYPKLRSFRESNTWCQQAQAEMRNAREAIDRLKEELAALDQRLADEETAFQTRNFAGKILAGRKERKALLAEKAQKEQSIQTINSLIQSLETNCSLVPVNLEEQKDFLRILAQRRKDLLQRKKEIAAGVKAARRMGGPQPPAPAQAQAKKADQLAARLQAEDQLRPGEDESAAIDRQLQGIGAIVERIEWMV